jgi:hypothetical protein
MGVGSKRGFSFTGLDFHHARTLGIPNAPQAIAKLISDIRFSEITAA